MKDFVFIGTAVKDMVEILRPEISIVVFTGHWF